MWQPPPQNAWGMPQQQQQQQQEQQQQQQSSHIQNGWNQAPQSQNVWDQAPPQFPHIHQPSAPVPQLSNPFPSPYPSTLNGWNPTQYVPPPPQGGWSQLPHQPSAPVPQPSNPLPPPQDGRNKTSFIQENFADSYQQGQTQNDPAKNKNSWGDIDYAEQPQGTGSGTWTQPEPEVGKHEGVKCDGCGVENIAGIRHKCHFCYNYDLCDRCFRNRAESKNHRASHPMEDLAPGKKPGKTKPQRDSPVGKYVRRGRDWKWDDQDKNGRGTCVALEKEWVTVRWEDGTKNMYRWGKEGAYDVFIEGVAEAKDLIGCVVRRGPDWKWDDQDGNGEGVIEGQPTEGIALVCWLKSGISFQYRWGMEGAYDLLITSDKDPRKETQAPRAAVLPAPQKAPAAPPAAAAPTTISSTSTSSGGTVIDLDRETSLKVAVLCLVVFINSLKKEIFKVVPNLEAPQNLVDVYRMVYRVEQSIRFTCFTQQWRTYKFKHWFSEMNSETVSLPHLASCLIEFELNILPEAQTDDWKGVRDDWVKILCTVGGKQLRYPTAASDQGTGSKTYVGTIGSRSDLNDAMSQCKVQ